MRHRRDELRHIGLDVMVVSFEDGPMARLYAQETKLDWPLLVDEDRSLYEAYGMGNGSRWDVWGPSTWWAYLKEALRGRRPAPSTGGDPNQLGGNVLLDPEGLVRLHHVGRGPADRPSVGGLLDLVRRQQLALASP